jgi:glycosyltransferase involved in cell wall biosynthesis
LKNPLVSVIIPTYQRIYPLAELLEALSRQTFHDFEVVIVNDGGPSKHFLADYYHELQIRMLDQPNQGGIVARTRGMKEARGEYLMLIDDDDLILPDHMETLLREIQDVDFVYTDAEIFEYEIHNQVRIPTKRHAYAFKHDWEFIRQYSGFIPSGVLFRKGISDVIGDLDVTIRHHWDWDFFLRVCQHVQVKRIHRATALYAYSNNGDNQSARYENMRESLDLLCAKHQLGALETTNFFAMLDIPFVKERIVPTEIVWDGKPFVSRLIKGPVPQVFF